MIDRLDARQIFESPTVRTDNCPAMGSCCSGDDEIVRASGPTRSPHCHQQRRMISSYCGVIGKHRKRQSNIGDVGAAPLALGLRSQLYADLQLGNSDRCYGDVIIVVDQVIDVSRRSFGVDQKRRVEKQERHERSSISNKPRMASRSRSHCSSVGCRRSRSLASTPRPRETGSMCATALPCRVIVYRSPECSTASSRSENRRAASVAVNSDMKSDYQIYGRSSCRSSAP